MIGETILHYKILEKLGEGGMGEVYKAQDTKLDRFVALKFLPSQLTASEDDKARFIQEAKAASAMNHPNVCTIYSIEEHNGQLFIAMEFIEGKTLKDKKDSLSEKQKLEISVQVAEGLAAAHEKGIVHRDIKPENIMIRKDGITQIMDFGLAKLCTDKNASRLTKVGTTMGTLGYMSPEQIQGLDVDHRTDIFSFGIVLYEMFSGESPFKGMHETAIMYEIVNVEAPPLSTIKNDIDPELDRIILECLEKDKDERCQSAKELAKDLRKVKKSSGNRKSRVYNVNTDAFKKQNVETKISGPSSSFSVDVMNRRFDLTKLFKLSYLPWLLSVILLVMVVYFWLGNSSVPTNNFIKFEQLTEQSGEELYPDISPDGNYITYTKSVNRIQHIFLQRIGGGNTIDLTKDSKVDNYQSAFSPDGQLIVFRSDRDGGGLFLMGSTGESVRRLTDFGYNPAWSPDGERVIYATELIEIPYSRVSTSALWITDLKTGKNQKIYDGDAVQPSWSPGRKWIAFWGLPKGTGQRAIWTISATGGKPNKITDDDYINWSPTWSADSKYLYFSSSRGGSMNLWKVKINESSGETEGDFESITTPSISSSMAKISHDGKKLIYVSEDKRANIYKINFDPKTEKAIGNPEPITEGSKQFLFLDISPDNKKIAAASFGQQEDLYTMNIDGSGLLKLTNDIYKDRGPKWSPDGKSLIFYSTRSGKYEIWQINIDGSNSKLLTNTNGSANNPNWFPNGKIITFYGSGNNTITYLHNLDSTIDQKLISLPEFNEKGKSFAESSVSPDGNFIAGDRIDNTSGDYNGIIIYSIISKSYKKLSETGDGPIWFNDSKRILYSYKNSFFVLDSKTGISKMISDTKQPMPYSDYFSISPDNKSIYFIKQEKESDVWMGYLK